MGDMKKLNTTGNSMNIFLKALEFRFYRTLAQINKGRRDDPLALTYQVEEADEKLWVTLQHGEQAQSFSLPIPYYDENSNYVIGRRVKRAVGSWLYDGDEMDYWQLMAWLLTDRIEEVFPSTGRRNQLDRLIYSFETGTAPLAFRSFQDLSNSIINKLPLTGTPLETWAMCNRVVILDPEFDALGPKEALEYQKEINKKYFPWTSIGLSDSGMTDNNLLKEDLRKLTPFGIKHHNPMRNLYQTLGMKGEESPWILTKSEKQLQNQGIIRGGWNWMTCFLDTPLTFEDQLLVDKRHLGKFTLEQQNIMCFGEVSVGAGQELEEGDVVSVEPNGSQLRFWTRADNATVNDVYREEIVFNGQKREVTIVEVETKHTFKEGIKLTNRHGNKGVVVFADLGVVADSGRGREVPIDLIVSAKTVGKRKNYGQVLELLLTLLKGEGVRVELPDSAEFPPEKLKQVLVKNGYSEDGTSEVRTQWGTFRAVCGWGFWGLIKNPENQLWTRRQVLAEDGRGQRRFGNKVSHIELKALTTIFGPKNPVVKEILSHQQGTNDVQELVKIIDCLRGNQPEAPVIDWQDIKPLEQNGGYFHSKAELNRTVVDEAFLPSGFLLRLPRTLQIFSPDDAFAETVERVLPEGAEPENYVLDEGQNIFLNTLYVPEKKLRTSWLHPTGMWGLSDIGGFLNNITLACHQLHLGQADESRLQQALSRYFAHVSRRLSSKKGEISTYCLSVRYPNSVKATATLSQENLPQNWIQIHEDMAADLGVRDGDYVIAERFPCLGFMSLRIQRVSVTQDPQCKFVIRVSGNSLVSQNLDFDGDVLYLMSFHNPEAKQRLQQEFHLPNPRRKELLEQANNKKVPEYKEMSLEDFQICTFPELTPDRQAEIVADLTGVKRGTGPVVALAYNTMRILEGTLGYKDIETNLDMETILDKVANSVFSQKHAGESLEEKCREAICTANLDKMLEMGFPEDGSRKLCEIIRKEAESVGVRDLEAHYDNHLEKGTSNVINLVVRKKHKVYFATRASLHAVSLLNHLDAPATDLCAYMWHISCRKEDVKHEEAVSA